VVAGLPLARGLSYRPARRPGARVSGQPSTIPSDTSSASTARRLASVSRRQSLRRAAGGMSYNVAA